MNPLINPLQFYPSKNAESRIDSAYTRFLQWDMEDEVFEKISQQAIYRQLVDSLLNEKR